MADIKIGRMVIGSVSTNCYFLYREGSGEAIVFDPADNGKYIFDQLQERGISVKAICLTHAHFDHIWGCNELKELSGAKVYALEKEKELCEDPVKNVSAQVRRPYTVNVDEYVRDNDVLNLCDISLKVIETPGHTIGSTCYYIDESEMLIAGDTLFQASVGRTDLPTGSESQIVRSINDKLMTLPESVKVYPGHGNSTTIGYEKMYNPFVGIV